MRVLYLYEAHRERQVPLVPPPFETDRTLTETGRSTLNLSRISDDYTNNQDNQVSKSSLSAYGNDVNQGFSPALPANSYSKTIWTPQTNNTTKNIVPSLDFNAPKTFADTSLSIRSTSNGFSPDFLHQSNISGQGLSN